MGVIDGGGGGGVNGGGGGGVGGGGVDSKTMESVNLFASTVCVAFPSYFSNYSVLILIATAVITQLSHVCKICLMVIIAGMLWLWWYRVDYY